MGKKWRFLWIAIAILAIVVIGTVGYLTIEDGHLSMLFTRP